MSISNKQRFGNIALETLYINHYRRISQPSNKHRKPHNKAKRIKKWKCFNKTWYLFKNNSSPPTDVSNWHDVKISGILDRLFSSLIYYHYSSRSSRSTLPTVIRTKAWISFSFIFFTSEMWHADYQEKSEDLCNRKKYDINKIYGLSCDLLFVNVCVRFKLDFRVSHSTL